MANTDGVNSMKSSLFRQGLIPGQPRLHRERRHALDPVGRALPVHPHRRGILARPVVVVPLPGRPVGGVAPVLLDPPPPLVRVLEADAGDDGDPAVPAEPHVLAEQLRLPLEALALVHPAEVDPAVQQRLRRERHRAVPAAEDLERPVRGEAGPRVRVRVEGEQAVRPVPGAVLGDVEEEVARERACGDPGQLGRLFFHTGAVRD